MGAISTCRWLGHCASAQYRPFVLHHLAPSCSKQPLRLCHSSSKFRPHHHSTSNTHRALTHHIPTPAGQQQPLQPHLQGLEAALEGSRLTEKERKKHQVSFIVRCGEELTWTAAVSRRAVWSLPSSEGWVCFGRFPALRDFCNSSRIIQDKIDFN